MNAQFQKSGCNQPSWLQWHTSVKSQLITEEEPSSCQPADARRIIWKALFLLLCALSLSPCTHCNYKYDNLSRVTSMKWNDVMYYCRNTCLGKQTKQHRGQKGHRPSLPYRCFPINNVRSAGANSLCLTLSSLIPISVSEFDSAPAHQKRCVWVYGGYLGVWCGSDHEDTRETWWGKASEWDTWPHVSLAAEKATVLREPLTTKHSHVPRSPQIGGSHHIHKHSSGRLKWSFWSDNG